MHPQPENPTEPAEPDPFDEFEPISEAEARGLEADLGIVADDLEFGQHHIDVLIDEAQQRVDEADDPLQRTACQYVLDAIRQRAQVEAIVGSMVEHLRGIDDVINAGSADSVDGIDRITRHVEAALSVGAPLSPS